MSVLDQYLAKQFATGTGRVELARPEQWLMYN